LYSKAANCYKLGQDKYGAAEMFMKCADMEEGQSGKAGQLKEAALQYQGVDNELFAKYMI
jgi:hypothetical protein